MIWEMVLSSGKIFIKKLNGTFNSSKYKALLSQKAVSIIKTELGDDFLLQQDNSPVHTSSMICLLYTSPSPRD